MTSEDEAIYGTGRAMELGQQEHTAMLPRNVRRAVAIGNYDRFPKSCFKYRLGKAMG